MLVDSHCHLNFPSIYNNRKEIVKRALNNRISILLTVSTSLEEIEQNLEITEEFNNVYCSIGVHPNNLTNTGVLKSVLIEKLENVISDKKKVVAIGETGYDLYRNKENFLIQKEAFIQHIEIANKFDFPIIIHTRNAEDETIDLLSNYKIRGVFHCFNGSFNLLKFAIKKGFYISISGLVTFKNAKRLREIIELIPLQQLLIETDSPFLSPEPFRGKINEPSFLIHTAKKISEIRKMDIEDFGNITTNNFYKLFLNSKENIFK